MTILYKMMLSRPCGVEPDGSGWTQRTIVSAPQRLLAKTCFYAQTLLGTVQ
jgi:hypothetical protein